MLRELIGERIAFKDTMSNWEEAIKVAARPLLEEGFIKQEYMDAMIQNVHVNGAYMIIVPGFAMPHARPECGAVKTGMSILHLKEVEFPEEQKVQVLLALAAADANVHLDAMADLAEILIDDDKMEQLFGAKEASQIKEVFN